MTGSSKVSVPGPLEEFAEGFLAELAGLGYSSRSSEAQLGLMKHLSGWLAAQGLTPGELTAEVADQFAAARRCGYSKLSSPRALVPLLTHLRNCGVTPVMVPVALADGDVLMDRFAQYLTIQRGLAPATVRSYVSQVRPLLARFTSADWDWASLTARQVADFVSDRAIGQRPRSVAVGANALRAWLRWMWREGIVPSPLADAVGSVAAPLGTVPPKSLSASQVRDLIAALPAGPVRLRDEAMLALMWRLGLRAGEVASLRLEDINWRVGVLAVHGKGRRLDEVPLPVDVGQLLVAYLQRARPGGVAHREVFLALDAPHGPLTGPAVSSVVARALARASIEGPGAAHRLRHTAACGVLAAGGGLVEVGQLLRHSSLQATAIYARSDLTALDVLARPWPIGATR